MINIANPVDVGPSDDDISVVIWKNGNKQLVLHLNIYGSFGVRGGLCDPARGTVVIHKFEEAWEWFCDSKEELPEHKCIECGNKVTICNDDGLCTCMNCLCEMRWYGNGCVKV
jgi:hypothetical protein